MKSKITEWWYTCTYICVYTYVDTWQRTHIQSKFRYKKINKQKNRQPKEKWVRFEKAFYKKYKIPNKYIKGAQLR